MIKTDEELTALKNSWVHDPIWDIEETEGFEEHKDELVNFRLEMEAQWKEKAAQRITERIQVLKMSTGIDEPMMAESLFTFSEIENDLVRLDRPIEEDASFAEAAQFEIMRAQARATLLLAAQVKRVADLLEESVEEASADDGLAFMSKLYKVE